MLNLHSLDGVDLTPATLELEWVVTIDTPTAGVEQVTVVFAAHVDEEPTSRVHEAFGSRSTLLDDHHNPNRYWNRPDADLLHGTAVDATA